MYPVQLGTRVVEALRKERLVILDPQQGKKEKTRANEKCTRDPENAYGSY
jgi:hypothetical protein